MKLTHTLLTLLVCSTVVLAGCTGMGGLTGDSSGGADDGADANAGNGGGDGNSGSNAAGNADVELREEGWLNPIENSYVFEINNTTSGSGTATLNPPPNATGRAERNVTVTYEGDKTFEKAYKSNSERPFNTPLAPVMNPLLEAGIKTVSGGISEEDKEDLAVGFENAKEERGAYNDAVLTEKVTGVDSYGGVSCYFVEVKRNDTPYFDTCIVPYEDNATRYYDNTHRPYAAFYDKNGKIVEEVKLIEIKEG